MCCTSAGSRSTGRTHCRPEVSGVTHLQSQEEREEQAMSGLVRMRFDMMKHIKQRGRQEKARCKITITTT